MSKDLTAQTKDMLIHHLTTFGAVQCKRLEQRECFDAQIFRLQLTTQFDRVFEGVIFIYPNGIAKSELGIRICNKGGTYAKTWSPRKWQDVLPFRVA